MQEEKRKNLVLTYSSPEKRQALKERLLGIKPSALTDSEREVLTKITEEEELENKAAGIIRQLTERADKWGRKAFSQANTSITDEVGQFSASEKKLLGEAKQAYEYKKRDVRKAAETEMQAIQRKLNGALDDADRDYNAALEKIRNQFQVRYAECAGKINQRKEELINKVGVFTAALSRLTLEQLERVASGDSLVIQLDGKDVTVVCPDQEA